MPLGAYAGRDRQHQGWPLRDSQHAPSAHRCPFALWRAAPAPSPFPVPTPTHSVAVNSVCFSRRFNASRAGPVHLLICHRHTPSSTTVPEGRPRKATFSHTSSRADPSPSKICRTATVGSWPLGVGGGSEAGQQRNSTGALALLVFLGGPCNTISKYKSKSIKGADTLPPSPSSAHLYSSIPQSLCLGDPKREE